MTHHRPTSNQSSIPDQVVSRAIKPKESGVFVWRNCPFRSEGDLINGILGGHYVMMEFHHRLEKCVHCNLYIPFICD
jgi:hypothetical protein